MYFALIMRPITLAYSILLSSKVSFELPWIQVICFLPQLLCVPYQTPEKLTQLESEPSIQDEYLTPWKCSSSQYCPTPPQKTEVCHILTFVMK